jgi:dTDP-4-amino-4,6-dideoxygalactose transaminase
MPTYSVPYTAFGPRVATIKSELLRAFEEVLDSGRYILGPNTTAFENEFASYCQAHLGLGISNGTCALILALRSLKLEKGDEVITAPNSFVATAASIALTGAKPVFVDIRDDLNIDPGLIEAAITPWTRAIIPVHLTGRPARMDEITEIASRHDLIVIEDAAQAVGASYQGRRVGSWGRVACFSLHPLKNLHAFGDAGMVTTNDPVIRDRIALSRNHGLVNRDRCTEWGFNARLDELHAALLRVELRHLDRWTAERRRVAMRYNELLRPYVQVPDEGPGEFCVYQTYVIQADRRDDLQRHLQENGVEALVHYPTPIHLQPAAQHLGYTAADFPVTMRAASRIMSLPLYPEMSVEQQDRVVSLIAGFYGH